MNKKQIFQLGLSAILIFVLAFGLASCKKDDNPAGPAGPVVLPTYDFGGASPSISIPSGTAVTTFRITGGTPPFTIADAPNISIAEVVTSGDTVMIWANGPGTDSVTITDNSLSQSPKISSPPKSITIYFTILSGGGGGTNYGSGTISFNSDKGNKTFTGTGTWPPSGQGVLAGLSNSGKTFQLVGYNHLSGSMFDYIFWQIEDSTGISAGKVYNDGSTVRELGIGMNVDTSSGNEQFTYNNPSSGSIIIDSLTSTRLAGRFMVTARRSSDGDSIVVSSGEFHVTFINGVLPIGDNNGGGGGGGGGSDIFEFPVPTVDNMGGILVAQNIIYDLGGTLYNYTYGFGAFFGATTSNLVYGGIVMLNDSTLDTMSYGGKLTYMGQGNVTFDGSSSANFTVSGSGGIPAFNASIVTPVQTTITAPAMNATISRSSNLDITWNGTGADSLVIMITGHSGGAISKSGVVNDGSLTISSSELAGITAGSGAITVIKYKYVVHAEGGKNYVIVAQTYQYVSVMFN